MDKPDFSKYSESQLRQILTRIDKERFPDRVQEIQARLAQLEADRPAHTETDDLTPYDGPPEIAGFWRRIGAFLIDVIIMGLVGLCLGLFLRDQFEAMGAWGRVVGFFIAIAYFSTMESRLFQGATIGKRMLDIKVTTAAGLPLSFGKALLRSAVFNVPYFLNGAVLSASYTDFALPALQALVVFGLGGAMFYLYLFNRRTRQSIHDLLVDAVVVRSPTMAAPRLLPVWKGHIAMVAALFIVMAGGFTYMHSKLGNSFFQPLLMVQQQVSRIPGVRSANVLSGTQYINDKHFSFLSINAVTNNETADEKTLVRSIEQIVLTTYPAVQQLDALSVSLVHGYDIGIASSWRSKRFNVSPDDLRHAPGTKIARELH